MSFFIIEMLRFDSENLELKILKKFFEDQVLILINVSVKIEEKNCKQLGYVFLR